MKSCVGKWTHVMRHYSNSDGVLPTCRALFSAPTVHKFGLGSVRLVQNLLTFLARSSPIHLLMALSRADSMCRRSPLQFSQSLLVRQHGRFVAQLESSHHLCHQLAVHYSRFQTMCLDAL